MNSLTIFNKSDSLIHFSVAYFLEGKLYTKFSPDFVPGTSKQIELPINAVSIVFTVSMLIRCCKYKKICQEALYSSETACYRVIGSSSSATCQKIPCGNNDQCCKYCCKCCSHY